MEEHWSTWSSNGPLIQWFQLVHFTNSDTVWASHVWWNIGKSISNINNGRSASPRLFLAAKIDVIWNSVLKKSVPSFVVYPLCQVQCGVHLFCPDKDTSQLIYWSLLSHVKIFTLRTFGRHFHDSFHCGTSTIPHSDSSIQLCAAKVHACPSSEHPLQDSATRGSCVDRFRSCNTQIHQMTISFCNNFYYWGISKKPEVFVFFHVLAILFFQALVKLSQQYLSKRHFPNQPDVPSQDGKEHK